MFSHFNHVSTAATVTQINQSCCIAEPTFESYGWYRLSIACWLLIVVGWYASTVSAIKDAVINTIQQVEVGMEQMANDVTNRRLPVRV